VDAGSSLTISNVDINNNTSARNGGGLFAVNHSNIFLSADQRVMFAGNSASVLYSPPDVSLVSDEQWQGIVASVSAGLSGDMSVVVFNNYDINYAGTYELTVYTVTYDINGGSGTVPTESVKVAGALFAAAVNTITAPPGQQFNAWNTQVDGGGMKFTEGQEINMPADNLVLYAHWIDIPVTSVTVIFDAQGGILSVTDKNVVVGKSYGELPEPVFAKHTFQGWYSMPTGGDKITEDTVVVNTETHILYAPWVLTVQSDNDPPSNPLSGTVSVAGGAVYGGTISIEVSTSSSGPFVYFWTRDGVAIGGNRASYTVTAEDIGHVIKCEIVAAGSTGSIEWSSGVVGKAPGFDAPSGIGGVAPGEAGGNEFKITGTSSSMEYSSDTSFSNAYTCGDGETAAISV
jgi:hypothetical protein